MIGTKLVKYDIFGENVLIASKIRMNSESCRVCISQETLNLLSLNARVIKNYELEEFKTFNIKNAWS
jgi:class 3 adenylate cyclase